MEIFRITPSSRELFKTHGARKPPLLMHRAKLRYTRKNWRAIKIKRISIEGNIKKPGKKGNNNRRTAKQEKVSMMYERLRWDEEEEEKEKEREPVWMRATIIFLMRIPTKLSNPTPPLLALVRCQTRKQCGPRTEAEESNGVGILNTQEYSFQTRALGK